jgi:hypothetical protein
MALAIAPDYHVEIDGHWYSTPYRLIRELIDVRIADKTVEIFHKGQRIASHARAPNRRGHTTICRSHAERPASHPSTVDHTRLDRNGQSLGRAATTTGS